MPIPLGVEGVKGLAEKLTGLVRFPFMVRAIFPGIAAAVVLLPMTEVRVEIPSKVADSSWSLLIVLAVPLAFGILVSSAGSQIYKIYEGRLFWPQWLFDWATRGQVRRLSRLKAAADEAEKANRTLLYNEIWYKIRAYPLDNSGYPYASHPTLLGNILAEYESYPETRYGMDSVFYWPRLWLVMDKEKKGEIDAEWSVADGLLYVSAVAFCGGVLWILTGGLAPLTSILGEFWEPLRKYLHLPLGSPARSVAGGAVLVALGYVCYRLSLPSHRRNGEFFKAVFDLYRDKITPMTCIGQTELTAWKGTWSYLQYLTIRCVNCGEYFEARLNECKCGYPATRSLKKLRRDGR